MRKQACRNCKFWSQAKIQLAGSTMGHCKAEPPRLEGQLIDGVGVVGVWPVTDRDDSCGRFKDPFE